MRIVADRCRRFEYTVTEEGPCAVEFADTSWVGRPFFDCLLVTVGVEPGDSALADAAARIVRRMVAETDAAYIVVNGHLRVLGNRFDRTTAGVDELLSELADTLDVLAELSERLEEHGERVHLVPFGWTKTYRVEPFEPAVAQRVIHLSAFAADPATFPAVTRQAGSLVASSGLCARAR
ncbi:hypothetical protein [Nocardia donostiensis]|nr:hypothetical protein [Nocardia donostiensis]